MIHSSFFSASHWRPRFPLLRHAHTQRKIIIAIQVKIFIFRPIVDAAPIFIDALTFYVDRIFLIYIL